MRQECIQYAKDNGIFNKIQFIDKDSEMSTYYQTADVFCCHLSMRDLVLC